MGSIGDSDYYVAEMQADGTMSFISVIVSYIRIVE
jgi:hypothetical protein